MGIQRKNSTAENKPTIPKAKRQHAVIKSGHEVYIQKQLQFCTAENKRPQATQT